MINKKTDAWKTDFNLLTRLGSISSRFSGKEPALLLGAEPERAAEIESSSRYPSTQSNFIENCMDNLLGLNGLLGESEVKVIDVLSDDDKITQE